MDHLFGSSSLMNVVNGIADRYRQQRRKAEAEASRAATRVIPIDIEMPDHVGGRRDHHDDGRAPPTAPIANTIVANAPPLDLTPFIREVAPA